MSPDGARRLLSDQVQEDLESYNDYVHTTDERTLTDKLDNKSNSLFKPKLEEFLKMNQADGFNTRFANLSQQIERDIAYMILYQICHTDIELKSAIQAETEMILSKFTSLRSVLIYVDAKLLPGKYDEAKTTVCVLGNTGAGKTSIIQTFKSQESFLTSRDNIKLLNTKVLELVENVELQTSQSKIL